MEVPSTVLAHMGPCTSGGVLIKEAVAQRQSNQECSHL